VIAQILHAAHVNRIRELHEELTRSRAEYDFLAPALVSHADVYANDPIRLLRYATTAVNARIMQLLAISFMIRSTSTAEVSVLYDREGRTLTVWFSDRHEEPVCEETGEEVVLMKDAGGRVIGFEKLNFSIPETDRFRVAIETTSA
jgi:hypothetical protein